MVQSLAQAKDFPSSFCVQTSSEAHSASCQVGTGGPLPWGKAQLGHVAVHSSPSSTEVKNEQELYFSVLVPVQRDSFYFSLFNTSELPKCFEKLSRCKVVWKSSKKLKNPCAFTVASVS
jgi:hypothetical protein